MKRLFICNTPYQIIVSIILSIQNYSEGDIKEILVTDNFNAVKDIALRLEHSGHFNKVYLAVVNDRLFPKSRKKRAEKYLGVFYPHGFIKNCLNNEELGIYDELYYNNDDLFFYSLLHNCCKKNKEIKVFRFEEGYSSYIHKYCSLNAQKIFNIQNLLMGAKNFEELLCGMYYFEPELLLFKSSTKIYTIQRELVSQIKEMIGKIFAVNNVSYDFNEKWIIFEESFFHDLGYNDDLSLYKKVVDLIGHENIIVKLHPRSRINRFEQMNIEKMEDNGAPWEAILLLANMQNTKFLALASGSVINARLMMGDRSEAYLLHNCVDTPVPSLNNDFKRFLIKFTINDRQNLRIFSNANELFEMLQQYK